MSNDKLPEPSARLSPAECELCDKAIFGIDADEAEFISVGIDRNAPDGMPVLIWITAKDGEGIGAIRLSATRARQVAADILATVSDA